MEVYNTIKENYWKEMTDKQLTKLFKQNLDSITASYVQYTVEDREQLRDLVRKVVKNQADDQARKELVTVWSDTVLANMEPAGRSRLYTNKKKEELSNRVQNIDPGKNLYEDLGVGRDAPTEEIEQVYTEKKAELEPKAAESEEAAKELEKISYAHEVLSDDKTRDRYAATGAEPTAESRLITSSIWYIRLKKQSPTVLEEFKNAADSVSYSEDLDSMILDLRGNVGGSLDILPYFLGPFIGKDQYAYELFQQGNYEPYKTKTGWLASLLPYKKVVVLIDENTQSSAEVMAATLKTYNVGVLVGTTTKGWGTIEKVFEMDTTIDSGEDYGIFLVHHITLRVDKQPIEGRGVDPLINIENPNWQDQLLAYFNSPDLVSAVADLVQ